MAASTVALLLVSSGFVAYELITYRQTMTEDLSTLASIVGDRSWAALTFEDKADAEETLGALRAKPHITAAALYNKEGKLFALYRPGKGRSGAVPAAVQLDGTQFGKDHLTLFRAIRFKGERIGTLYIESDLKEMRERFEQYARIVLLITLASSLVTYLLSMLLQRIISRPIFHLAEKAREVSLE